MARRTLPGEVPPPSDTRSEVENSNELAGPQKDAHRSSYATSAPSRTRKLPAHPPPPDPPRYNSNSGRDEAAVAATAAELEEAMQEVSRRGARIDALTCEVAWYKHWADSYWQQLQSMSAAAAAASTQQHQQQQLAAMASYQNAANQNFAAAAQNFANLSSMSGPPHASNSVAPADGGDSAAYSAGNGNGTPGGSGFGPVPGVPAQFTPQQPQQFQQSMLALGPGTPGGN